MNPINSNSKSFKRLNPHLYSEDGRWMKRAVDKIPKTDVPWPVPVSDITEAMRHGELRQIGEVAKLNRWEREYLAWLRTCGDKWIGVQNMTFKLAFDTRFTPDFMALDDLGMRAIDVKGFQREDALIKIKIAARLFPWCRFLLAKKQGGVWQHIEVKT